MQMGELGEAEEKEVVEKRGAKDAWIAKITNMKQKQGVYPFLQPSWLISSMLTVRAWKNATQTNDEETSWDIQKKII